ncbi:glutathione-dependent formaldehyde-activating enzyme [Colletotrichum plurivorum]|uniref:Glutathione-dependent formaldehyde-activating enzyme n=1 Tax=Colletotrichum plurivorum TaxID=2175906 RepID=A0A8H6KTK3_9PEZI|nr:glutathione-dependent formaldehyde-activating enzyme [Colletotrichum plurivorum]
MVLKGSCMCQAIKYESDDPQTTALCHCVDCQKVTPHPTFLKFTTNNNQWSGSAFTSNAVVPRASFKVTQGEPKFYDVTGASGKINKHFFCPTCGSGLYTELELMPDVTCIKAGGLDEGKAGLDGKPAVEFYCKDRVAYLGDVKGADQKPAFG